MPIIHPLAAVSANAVLAEDVQIGPYCVVEDDVVLGSGCRLSSHVVIKAGCRLGENNRLAEGVVIGGLPQHARCEWGDPSCGGVQIGSKNVFREHVTVHRALKEDAVTTIGDGNLMMVGAHVAHDCTVGNQTVLVNHVLLGGHVRVDDQACIGGGAAVHQHCRVGRLAMIGGVAKLTKDVAPFVLADFHPCAVIGLNSVGLRRAGLTAEERGQLKAAFRLIYRSGLPWQEMLAQLKADFPEGPAGEFYDFLAASTRGSTPARRQAVGGEADAIAADVDRPAVHRRDRFAAAA